MEAKAKYDREGLEVVENSDDLGLTHEEQEKRFMLKEQEEADLIKGAERDLDNSRKRSLRNQRAQSAGYDLNVGATTPENPFKTMVNMARQDFSDPSNSKKK